MFYDYADSGSWTESTYRANESDFQKIKLRQRVAVDMTNRTTKTKMVGQEVAMPVTLAPTGLTGMQHVAHKPIKIIVPFSPGSVQDALARSFSNELGAALGQPVLVENKAGAGGTMGTSYCE